jgi:hypothetical protein
MIKKEHQGLRYYQFESLKNSGIFHGIFTRLGGSSPEPWKSLNIGGTVGDKKSNVDSNLSKILKAVDISRENLAQVHQIHSAKALVVDRPQDVKFQNNSVASATKQPETVQEAIETLISDLPLKEKTTIANMTEDELIKLNANLGRYILDKFGLWSGNEKLVESCLALANYPLHDEDDAAAVIVKELWQKLRQTHKLRIVR